MRRPVVGGAVLLALAVAACGSDGHGARPPSSSSAGTKVLSVVATTTVTGDLARNVGGDLVAVTVVVKANVDPHDFEPTPADLDALARADVIVKNGVGLEKWFDDTIDSAEPEGRIVDASEGVAIRHGNGTDEEAAGDPHIWHNPQNAKIMAANIAKGLEAAEPAAAAAVERNLAAYSARLDALDADVQHQIAPLANKKVVTNHDAFGYYLDHFGLQYVGAIIPSFDSQAELSPRDVRTIVTKIKAEGVKAVFSESSLPAKTAEAIAQEAGVRVVAGPDALYGDTLGPPGSDGDTYVKMIEHNTHVFVTNLG